MKNSSTGMRKRKGLSPVEERLFIKNEMLKNYCAHHRPRVVHADLRHLGRQGQGCAGALETLYNIVFSGNGDG